MPEIRHNIATREWVVIATERAKRPEQFIQAAKERVEDRRPYEPGCPFCPGNEELDLERLRLPAEGDWQVRVVQNRYPALSEHGDLNSHVEGLNRSISGVGYHEVVVESRPHNTSPATADLADLELTLRAFQLRGRAYQADPRIAHAVYFKNHGLSAGASLLHPHAQIVALPVVPYSIHTRDEDARRYFDDHGECVFCHMRQDEERSQQRIVAESDYFTAFVPYAAYSPFHIWVLPRRHSDNFLGCSPEELADLSQMLRTLLRKIYYGLNDPDYNYVIRSSFGSNGTDRHLHWYLAVVPRVTRLAGFEMSSGMFINTALPEESAAFLRGVSAP